MPPATARALWSHVVDAAGLVATPLRPSDYLELVNPLWSRRTPRARVTAVRNETADARTLTLRPGPGWRGHRPGQFVQIGVTIDGVRHTRSYSISSAPGRAFAVTVKATPGGRVSPVLARSVEVGTVVTIGRPQGDFVLPDAPVRPLFVTAGSGITPVMSMLRDRVRRAAMPDVVHLHYAPTAAEVIFGDELASIANTQPSYRLHVVHTRAGGAARHFSAAQLDALCPDWREREVWVCGPAALLATVERHWHDAGLAPRLHLERFQVGGAPLPGDAVGGRVRFAASGCDADAAPDAPLLHVAERAGLRPVHGCRMGICHTCDVTLLAGRVRDLRTGILIDEAGRRVQPCVCAAAGDVALDL